MLDFLVARDYAGFVIAAVVLLGSIVLHEVAHALAADVQGDRTPRNSGRLTLNPVTHLDPFGTAALVLVGFGWGKPVPYTPENLRSRRGGGTVVALAGPAMNLALAIAGTAILRVLGPGTGLVSRFLELLVFLNLVLMLLNMVPVPPLDGARVLFLWLPPRRYDVVEFLDRWGFLILLALILFVLQDVLVRWALAVRGLLFGLVGLS